VGVELAHDDRHHWHRREWEQKQEHPQAVFPFHRDDSSGALHVVLHFATCQPHHDVCAEEEHAKTDYSAQCDCGERLPETHVGGKGYGWREQGLHGCGEHDDEEPRYIHNQLTKNMLHKNKKEGSSPLF